VRLSKGAGNRKIIFPSLLPLLMYGRSVCWRIMPNSASANVSPFAIWEARRFSLSDDACICIECVLLNTLWAEPPLIIFIVSLQSNEAEGDVHFWKLVLWLELLLKERFRTFCASISQVKRNELMLLMLYLLRFLQFQICSLYVAQELIFLGYFWQFIELVIMYLLNLGCYD
jgi:hypothetical protein